MADDNLTTIRPTDQAQKFAPDSTMHINKPVQDSAKETDRTIRPENKEDLASLGKGVKTFVLKGDIYELVNTLSESSGEAQVFLVKRTGEDSEYVLKVYYPNFDINSCRWYVLSNLRWLSNCTIMERRMLMASIVIMS